ncbi:MAG: alpha/beta hydrolase-fold protein [Pseudomonadota bacterium]
MKDASHWYSQPINQHIRLVRWGHYGTPVLLFPTAGGDAEEVERFGLIEALGPLMHDGRIKVYSCDSINGQAWISGQHSARHCSWLQNAFDTTIYREVVPAIHADCRNDSLPIISAGASIGAYNALASLCRHPDVFGCAIGMSGTYDLEKLLEGQFNDDFYFSSPLHYLPALADGPQLSTLRERFAVFAFGRGRWENPDQSWRLANLLGDKGVPNRVDEWGPQHDHDWPAWREMLPTYLNELA